MKKIFILTTILLALLFSSPVKVTGSSSCENRYLTLVNPVRGRGFWSDRSLKPLRDQYELVRKYDFPATWLFQYDALTDKELVGEVKKFDSGQERGVFLEVSKSLAEGARVVYPYGVSWSNPGAIFLSGYSPSERRTIIDFLFKTFKKNFGYYPRSAGAWWIDSYSLDYMKKKYGLKAVLIVADQKTTDNYGVWGQWWGVPYYPSKANILTPAGSYENKEDVVVIQWAQRHPTLAYGDGPKYSNYSLQANDYLERGKNTLFFEDLVSKYLDCNNVIGQITVGLETGIESSAFIREYANQLKALSEIPNLQALGMSQFADRFKQIYPDYPKLAVLKDNDSEWIFTPNFRENKKLGNFVRYNPNLSFPDYFIADRSSFLYRRLPGEDSRNPVGNWAPIYLLATAAFGALAVRKKMFNVWIVATLFTFGAFGLVLKSKAQYGWFVYYGSVVPNLTLTQVLVVVFSLLLFWAVFRKKHTLLLWLIPLSFGLDKVVSSLRYTFISGEHYFGIGVDALKFVGIKLAKDFSLSFVNLDFPSEQAGAILRFNFNKIWDRSFYSLLLYPLAHIAIAVFLYLFLRRLKPKLRKIILMGVIILFILQMLAIINADPRVVIPTGP